MEITPLCEHVPTGLIDGTRAPQLSWPRKGREWMATPHKIGA